MTKKKKEVKDDNYGKKVIVMGENGIVDYDPDSMSDVVGGERLSYAEYISIQKQSAGKIRGSFQKCYYNMPAGFKGQIEKRTKDKICFKRIYVDGMYSDGLFFEGKEDHVWMNSQGFEEFNEGDSVSFCAEVYRYLKTGNGKVIDFALRNPVEIKAIKSYELPSDEELIKQELDMIVCETCMLSESCSRYFCLLPKGERKSRVDNLYNAVKK